MRDSAAIIRSAAPWVGTFAIVGLCIGLLVRTWNDGYGDRLFSKARDEEPAPISLELNSLTTLGSPDAQVALVVFTDYQCPFCAKFATGSLPNIINNYVDSGKIILGVVNTPIEQLHPSAFAAAEMAECAAASGKFLSMHDQLFGSQEALAAGDLDSIRAAAGYPRDTFDACRKTGEMAQKVRRQQAAALAMGVTGTPTLMVGRRIEGTDRVLLTRRSVGALSERELSATIEAELAGLTPR